MKTILVCLSREEDTEELLNVALPLARRHGSHVIGLHVQTHATFHPGVSVHVPAEVYIGLQDRQKEDTATIKAAFDRVTSGVSTPCEWRVVKAAAPDRASMLVQAAHAADLVIMAQAEYDVYETSSYFTQESVIRGSGRPVLYIPTGCASDTLGKNVLIGWSATREAARAAHDALPLLQDGADITVSTVTKAVKDGYDDAIELASALDRHGHKVEIVQRGTTKSSVAEELSALAFERGADMIVTGAFGHSRLYDFVIGAVTLDLMRHARVPVLFSK